MLLERGPGGILFSTTECVSLSLFLRCLPTRPGITEANQTNIFFLRVSKLHKSLNTTTKKKMFTWMPRSPVECTMQYEVNGLPQLTWHGDFHCQKEINGHHAQIVWSLFVWRSRGSLWLCNTRCVAFPRMLEETWHRNRICSPLGASTNTSNWSVCNRLQVNYTAVTSKNSLLTDKNRLLVFAWWSWGKKASLLCQGGTK